MAISVEFLQIFNTYRYASMTDVVSDSLGAVLAAMVGRKDRVLDGLPGRRSEE